jgi:uncharacterized small protein (DUF1192 family)
MFDDEPKSRASAPLSALETEDLSNHSLKELEERSQRLHAEIERTQGVFKVKQQVKDAASSLFKS